MKVKKIIAAVCAAAAVLGLAGCNLVDKFTGNSNAGTASPVNSNSSKPTAVSTSSKRESKPVISEPTSEPAVVSESTSEPAVESEPASKPTSTPTLVDPNLLRPEVKNALDAHEAYMNEYCDFMKKYNAAEDKSSWMTGYFAILEKYSIAIDKLNELDDIELTDAETAYYLEVTTRVLAKMSETHQ